MIGRRLGRYEIVAKLGQGGMGAVWRARDTLLERDVALKTLPEESDDERTLVKRFLAEAKAASRLHHAGIATVYDTGEHDGTPFISFQLIEGRTLRDVVRSDGPLAIDEALRLVGEAAEALGYAHEQGVLHRDITARNIMVDESGHAVIVDFGLAVQKDQTRLTMGENALRGTAGYMAPESVQGEEADARTDLYGLGVILYELLTGDVPFRGARIDQVLYATVHNQADPPSRHRDDISPEIDQLVLDLLAKERDERPPTGTELAVRIATLRGHRTITVPISGSRRGSRAPWVIGVFAVTALAAVAVGTSVLWPTPVSQRVAVLAFEERISGGPSEPWRLEGLGTALVRDLGVPNERVVLPWATSRRYDFGSSDPVDLASELNVDRLVHGYLLRYPDSLVCRVTIVEGVDGSVVGTLEERVAAQEQIVLHQLLSQKIDLLLRGEDPSAADGIAPPPIPPARAQAHGLAMRGTGRFIEGTDDSTRRAQVLFEEAIAADSTFVDAWVGLGAIYTDRLYQSRAGGAESFELADRAFHRALELDPRNTRALEGIINVLFLKGEFVECVRVVQENSWARGDDIDILLLQGRALMAVMPDLAIAKYMRVLELDRNNREALWWLVSVLNWAGDHDGCMEISTRYLRQFPNDSEVRTWRGLSWMALGHSERAVNEVRVAVDSQTGNNLETSIYAGIVNRRAGDEAEATRLWSEAAARGERLLAASPSNHRVREHLAMLYGWLGDVDSMERVLDADPGTRECAPWCVTFELWFLIDLGREEELLRILTERVDRWGNLRLIDSFLHDLGYDQFRVSDGYRRFAEYADREGKRLRRTVTF